MVPVRGVAIVAVATALTCVGLLAHGALPIRAASPPPPPPPATTTTATATTTTTTTTTLTTTTTTTLAPVDPLLPVRTSPREVTVGLGGTIEISGECPFAEDPGNDPDDTGGGGDGNALGTRRIEVWEVGETATNVVHTGFASQYWVYDWIAPIDAQSLRLRVFCGRGERFTGAYPPELEIIVTFVAQIGPTTTVAEPTPILPETN